MPGKSASPRRRRPIRLSRSSCLTDRAWYPLDRSSWIVLALAIRVLVGASRLEVKEDAIRARGSRGHYATGAIPCQPSGPHTRADSVDDEVWVAPVRSGGAQLEGQARRRGRGWRFLGSLFPITIPITLAPFRFAWPRGLRLSLTTDPADMSANVLLY